MSSSNSSRNSISNNSMETHNTSWDNFAAAALAGLTANCHVDLAGNNAEVVARHSTNATVYAQIAAKAADALVAEKAKRANS